MIYEALVTRPENTYTRSVGRCGQVPAALVPWRRGVVAMAERLGQIAAHGENHTLDESQVEMALMTSNPMHGQHTAQ